MENFTKEKNKDKYNDWISPTKYTHPGEYKYCIGIDANGCDESRGKAITVELWSKPGDFDNVIVWPAKLSSPLSFLTAKVEIIGRSRVSINGDKVTSLW